MGELSESKIPSKTSKELSDSLGFDFESRMGKFRGSFEDFKVRRRLEETFKRFSLIENENEKFRKAMMKVLRKHKKTLDDLNDWLWK